MILKRMLSLLLVNCFLLSGCASYKPNQQPMATIEKCKCQQTLTGLTVGVDPYYVPNRTQWLFDNDFKDHELLAVNFVMSCPDGKEYSVKKSTITVADNNGRVFKPVSGKVAGDMVGRGYGMTVLWFFVGGIVGLVPSAIHTASVNTAIENDLIKAELPEDAMIKSLTHGFVYYDMEPYGKQGAPKEMKANLKLIDTATQETLAYEIKFDPNANW